MAAGDPGRVLSVQSHVVSGYVGNRAATFPLQTLGYDVDVINTVQFSNHTGYGYTNGHKTTPDQLAAMFEGLTTNKLAVYSRVLTGYVPGAEALRVVGQRIKRMKEEDPNVIYVLDPVMGDIGKGLYVSEEVVPIYKDLLRIATIITPNQFEVELLSDTTISSLTTLHASLHHLHTVSSVSHVAVSSIPLRLSLVAPLRLLPPPASYTRLLPDVPPPLYDAFDPVGNVDDEVLVCFASTWSDGLMDTWAFALPTIRGYFSGVGDLFSALVLAHFDNPESSSDLPPLAHAVSKSLLAVQQILLRTHLYSLSRSGYSGDPTPGHAGKEGEVASAIPSDDELDAAEPCSPSDPRRKARRMRMRELRIVQERALIADGGDGWPGRRLDWGVLLS